MAAGRIRYRIDLTSSRSTPAGQDDLFSDALLARIRRRNAPEWRTVWFDGRRSRVEEINVDYGVRSLGIQLREAGRPTVTYCKELRAFGFCVEHGIGQPVGREPPHLEIFPGTTSIAGHSCREGVYRGERQLRVWFTDEIEVDDPTGAVLNLEGVPGLVMRTEELAVSENDGGELVAVAELSFDHPAPEIFFAPPEYRRLDSVDAARAEDRRLLEQQAADEVRRRPLGPGERDMFLGEWLFDAPPDRILMEVARAGEGALRVRTTVLTARKGAPGRVREEHAVMLGRRLLIEDPPNFRLYELGDNGRSLRLANDGPFVFVRRA